MLGKVQDRFAESIQIQIAAAEILPTLLNKAAQSIVTSLLNGHKVIVCGYGSSYPNAQLLVSHLLYRYELARPSFAAVLLHFDGVLATRMTQDAEPDGLSQLYKKQFHAVAKEGDVLVVFSPFGSEDAIINVLHSAAGEGVNIIAFTSSYNDHTSGLLSEDDIEIPIPSSNEMRIIEGHQFSLNVLCELVDNLLFSQ